MMATKEDNLNNLNNPNGKDKIDIHERLTKIETKFDYFLKNHFPSLEKKVDKLNNRFWAVIILLIGNLVGLVFNLIK